MDNSFFISLDRLVLIGFFSGYPFIYLVIRELADNSRIKNITKTDIGLLLPFAYALVGVLYLGLLLKNLYPHYSFGNIKMAMQQPYLKIWGLLSILFFIPALSKKPVLSLLHSLVFFFFLLKDLLMSLFSSTQKEMLRNDMTLYTNSLLVNSAAFIFIVFIFSLYTRLKKQSRY
jgi:hypothetical protein